MLESFDNKLLAFMKSASDSLADLPETQKSWTKLSKARDILGLSQQMLDYYVENGLANYKWQGCRRFLTAKDMHVLSIVKAVSEDYGANLAGIRLLVSALEHGTDGGLHISEVTRFASLAGMGEDYVKTRKRTYGNKYKRRYENVETN